MSIFGSWFETWVLSISIAVLSFFVFVTITLFILILILRRKYINHYALQYGGE